MRPAALCALALSAALAWGCSGSQRLKQLQAMPDPDKEQLAKYRQFLTELQVDHYCNLPDLEARNAFIASLKIEERLAHYPKVIQDAIWAGEVIPGMDKPAVLLTWGSPSSREVDEQKAESGVEAERWGYARAERRYEVVLVNGYVTEVLEAGR